MNYDEYKQRKKQLSEEQVRFQLFDNLVNLENSVNLSISILQKEGYPLKNIKNGLKNLK